MPNNYPKAANQPTNAGTVHLSSRKVVTFEVTVNPVSSYDDSYTADEFDLMLNGRVLKRMDKWQAKRYGLLETA